MSTISAALHSLINGKKDICCLCLNAVQDEPIRLSDDVVIYMNNEECDKSLEEVLNSIFDQRMYDYMTSFNSFCEQCTKSAISCYKFIRNSQKNSVFFKNVLMGVSNSFEYTSNECGDSKSLFVSFSLQDFTSKHYYDTKQPPSTQKAVLKRFHNLDNDVLECQDCHKEFPTIWNLRKHYLRIHAEKNFKCSKCPKSFGSAAYLEAHRNECHCPVVCSECGKTFNNKYTLKKHELGHHLTLVCQDCGRIYKNKATFKKHIDQNVCGQKTRAHPSEAKFTCDYCNKKYTQKMSLRVHIQYEHGNYKAHVCEWCGKKFWAQSRLKAHIVKHTKERNFPCSICGGKFVSKASLLYHTRTHTGEKPYKCPHCEARFLSASRRSDHVKRHHLGGIFECDICHSKFNTRPFLQKHKKTHMKSNVKTNLSYDISKINNSKPNSSDQSKSLLTKLNTNSEMPSQDIWKMDELDEVEVQNFHNVMESAGVQIQHFGHGVFQEERMAADGKVFLEVPDDADDFIVSLLPTQLQ